MEPNYAKIVYEIYCEEVGGKAFNGDPLPSWDDFKKDPTKAKQVRAWEKVGEIVAEASQGRSNFKHYK